MSNWYHGREWLEYSRQTQLSVSLVGNFVKHVQMLIQPSPQRDTATGSMPSDLIKAFINMLRKSIFYERLSGGSERNSTTDTEISTLINAKQGGRNQYYISSIVDILAFLATNQLSLRGKLDAFDKMSERGCGLFLFLFEYTFRKDEQLAKVIKTIPRNATYTSHDIQNELIETMSSEVTEAIVNDIGSKWLTVKVNCTGSENISIVVRYIAEDSMEVTEHLLAMDTAETRDAETLTDTILQELTTAEQNTSRILSQYYDGAFCHNEEVWRGPKTTTGQTWP